MILLQQIFSSAVVIFSRMCENYTNKQQPTFLSACEPKTNKQYI